MNSFLKKIAIHVLGLFLIEKILDCLRSFFSCGKDSKEEEELTELGKELIEEYLRNGHSLHEEKLARKCRVFLEKNGKM